MLSNSTAAGQSICPPPFLDAALFPANDGYMKGRFCSNILGAECCLPCPHGEWLYPDHFESILERTKWMNIPGLVCSIFLITSFIFLPVSKTNRHYLNLCLVISVAMMNIGFLIPLGAKPAQCDDPITPNDMKSSTACALSGALVIAGGWFGVMWVCLITLALHLQICWHVTVVERKVFMCGAIAAGCIIPTVGMAVALSLSGVSFRFGDTCHVNAENSLGALWIPLMVFACFTLVMQLATFVYCLRVYLASLGDDSAPVTRNSGIRSSMSNRRMPLTPKEALYRIQRVIQLQWKAMLIVMIIVADVIFFAIVFVSQDRLESALESGHDSIIPWVTCLIASGGNKEMCYADTESLRINEATVISVLVLLSLNGFWCLILLGRYSMLTGWYELVTGTGSDDDDPEFVSADAIAYKDPADYEMLANPSDLKKSPTLVTPPEPALYGVHDHSGRPNHPDACELDTTRPSGSCSPLDACYREMIATHLRPAI